MKIKKNDLVIVITGKNKGKKGKVLHVYPKKQQAVVEKINVVKKHIKKRQTTAGEIIKFEAPLHISNVMVICPHCNKATRVQYQKTADHKKERICKHCKGILDSSLPTP
jgi:large subunit ribosomal protein L24